MSYVAVSSFGDAQGLGSKLTRACYRESRSRVQSLADLADSKKSEFEAALDWYCTTGRSITPAGVMPRRLLLAVGGYRITQRAKYVLLPIMNKYNLDVLVFNPAIPCRNKWGQIIELPPFHGEALNEIKLLTMTHPELWFWRGTTRGSEAFVLSLCRRKVALRRPHAPVLRPRAPAPAGARRQIQTGSPTRFRRPASRSMRFRRLR